MIKLVNLIESELHLANYTENSQMLFKKKAEWYAKTLGRKKENQRKKAPKILLQALGVQLQRMRTIQVLNTISKVKAGILAEKQPRFDRIIGEKEVFFSQTMNYIYIDPEEQWIDLTIHKSWNLINIGIEIKGINNPTKMACRLKLYEYILSNIVSLENVWLKSITALRTMLRDCFQLFIQVIKNRPFGKLP